ncbi:hypothetical protein IL38_23790 [Actinopolyspora erythraea]|uniref:DUF5753 domain-containing protein n=1 Tax=Actinopolyspora erythraea TaxID=414996 RepID=A0ABR4WY64_9ACTN|nr:helix-turn-helix transcriptional regulator [Actinopolyspora erythraea]KGI79335.1 hypothetical protein IL38_23790 [Actinopolyspora erythraea]
MSATVTAQRKQLGNELRRAREAAGLNQKEAADLVLDAGGKCSQAKMTRIEAGTVSIRQKDLAALLTGYGITGERADTLMDMASSAGRRRGQWAGYRSVIPEYFRMYTDLEPVATRILAWEDGRIHALLQSEHYMLQQFVSAGAAKVNWLVKSRMERQRVLEKPPRNVSSVSDSETDGAEVPYTFIVGEAALRRMPGGGPDEVMADQMEHLLWVSKHYEHVAVHVLPFDAEVASTPTDFTILRFDEKIKDFAYLAHPSGGLYLDDEDDLQYFADAYAALHGAVLGRAESREFIKHVAEKYGVQN